MILPKNTKQNLHSQLINTLTHTKFNACKRIQFFKKIQKFRIPIFPKITKNFTYNIHFCKNYQSCQKSLNTKMLNFYSHLQLWHWILPKKLTPTLILHNIVHTFHLSNFHFYFILLLCTTTVFYYCTLLLHTITLGKANTNILVYNSLNKV